MDLPCLQCSFQLLLFHTSVYCIFYTQHYNWDFFTNIFSFVIPSSFQHQALLVTEYPKSSFFGLLKPFWVLYRQKNIFNKELFTTCDGIPFWQSICSIYGPSKTQNGAVLYECINTSSKCFHFFSKKSEYISSPTLGRDLKPLYSLNFVLINYCVSIWLRI
jgi:hypothetical protein